MVSGGQAMFLVDAVCQNKKITPICTHHEQSAGMSADAYGRISGKLGVALVTAGPGSINVLNGVVGGYTDSSPMMVISGQSALSFVEYQDKTKIRQHGIQGINIRPIVEPITKYFKTVDDPAKILCYMEKAYEEATTGRPGPVWIDVPLNIQGMEVPMKILDEYEKDYSPQISIHNEISEAIKLLRAAKRPLIIAGQGIKLGGAEKEFDQFCIQYKIPVVTSRLAIDLLDSEDRLYVGRPGNYGDRPANLAIQNADLIISIGSRLASATVGHDANNFGKHAKKIVVDIDQKELNKPGVKIDIKINCDVKVFLNKMLENSDKLSNKQYEEWIEQCNLYKNKYPVVQENYKSEDKINSYYFTDVLAKKASEKEVILVDTGSCFHVVCQAWKIKKGQKFLTTGGLSSMGYWVAGIGACMACDGQRTIVITGDGSLQMNIQEFATIKHNNLPIKVFIFNNNGYLLIRHTQMNFMDGRLLGEGPDTGVWCPDSLEIAKAYGIKGVRIENVNEIEAKIEEVLNYDGPVICDVILPEWQLIIPRVSSDKMADGSLVSRAFEDMFPYLSAEELKENMVSEKD